MAYVSSAQNDDQDTERNAAQIFSSGAPGGVGYSGGSPASAAAPPPSASSGGAGAGGSSAGGVGYVNYDKYFNANKGAAQNTANSVSTQVGNEAAGAQSGLQQAEQTFNQQVGAGSPYGSPAGTSFAPPGTQGNGQTATAGPMQTNSPLSSGKAVTVGPAASNLSQTPGQTYTGPTDLTSQPGYGQLAQNTAQAANDLAATGTPQGLGGFLTQQNAGRGGYTQGDSLFDAALTNTAGAGDFANLRNKYGDLNAALAKANADASNFSQQAANYTNQTSNSLQAAQQAASNAPGQGAPTNWNGFDWGTVFQFGPLNSMHGGMGMPNVQSGQAPSSQPQGWSQNEWNAYQSLDAQYYGATTKDPFDFNPKSSHVDPNWFAQWWAKSGNK